MSSPSVDSVHVVTSCSLDGWDRYGYKCLSSLLPAWPKEINVHIVSEDHLPLEQVARFEGRTDRLTFHPLYNYGPAKNFFERHKDNNSAKGKAAHMYDFRRDAYRFSKKVFAIKLVSMLLPAGRLLWLDADTVTLHPVPLELLHRLPPDDYDIAFLDRSKLRYHSECGFVGYNLNRASTREFIAKFVQLYETDEVFKLKEWHDSWVFDWLRKSNGNKCYPIPYTNITHPFNYSELGKYMDHLKGARKKLGISVEHPRLKRTKG